MARSGSCISAIFASTSLSPAARFLFARSSAFSSLARSFIAARSSAVNPPDFFAPIVASFAGCSVTYSVRQKEVYPRLRALTSRFLIGLLTCFAMHDGILDVQRLGVLPVDPVANAARPREVAQVLRCGGAARHMRDRTSRRICLAQLAYHRYPRPLLPRSIRRPRGLPLKPLVDLTHRLPWTRELFRAS